MTNPSVSNQIPASVLSKIYKWAGTTDNPPSLDLHQTGLDRWSFLIATLLTCALYVAMNLWLTRSVDSAYHHAKASQITTITSAEDRVSKLVRTIGGDPRFEKESYLREALRALPQDASWRDLILSTIAGVQNSIPKEFHSILDQHMTARRSGFPFFYLGIMPVSGGAIVEEFRAVSPTWSHKNALIEGDDTQMKAGDIDGFLIKLIDRASQENRPQIRSLMRVSGWVQWATFWMMWLVLVLVVKRYLRLQNADFKVYGVNDDSLKQVYSTLDFLIGLLPSLGFVGTVLGMGDALLTADGLFSSTDKVQAINVITKHLGFAFDTTLIGLVTAMICGAAVLSLRTWESNRLRTKG